jgi:hypothetical protein
MPQLNRNILEAALEGLERQQAKIDEHIDMCVGCFVTDTNHRKHKRDGRPFSEIPRRAFDTVKYLKLLRQSQKAVRRGASPSS